LALSVVALLLAATMFAAIGTTVWLASVQKGDALRINLAGRQRMLIERLARLAYAHRRSGDARREIKTTENLFGKSLSALRNGGTTYADVERRHPVFLRGGATGAVARKLDEVRLLWNELEGRVAQRPARSASLQGRSVRKLAEKAVESMDEAVAMFQAEAEARLATLRQIQFAAFATAVVFAIAGGAYVWTLFSSLLRSAEKQRGLARRLVRASRAARAASAAKEQFLANASHELRTPLTTIIGLTELLLEQPVEQREWGSLNTIRKAADSLLRMVDDILDYAEIGTGALRLNRSAFKLRSAVGELVSAMQSPAAEKGLSLSWQVDARVPEELVGDPWRLKQAIAKILANAIKFTEDGGVRLKVTVESRMANMVRLLFNVTDTGVGVAPGKQKGIFEPFEQADGGLARRFEGMGLGLSISARLAELMGGRLEVSSLPGVGTTACLALCFAVRQEREAAPPEAS
jgi:Signal transduction histidine kinase